MCHFFLFLIWYCKTAFRCCTSFSKISILFSNSSFVVIKKRKFYYFNIDRLSIIYIIQSQQQHSQTAYFFEWIHHHLKQQWYSIRGRILRSIIRNIQILPDDYQLWKSQKPLLFKGYEVYLSIQILQSYSLVNQKLNIAQTFCNLQRKRFHQESINELDSDPFKK